MLKIRWKPKTGEPGELQAKRADKMTLISEEFKKEFTDITTKGPVVVGFLMLRQIELVQEDTHMCYTDKVFMIGLLIEIADAAEAHTLTPEFVQEQVVKLDAKVSEACSQKLE